MKTYGFPALIFRQRYIKRWGLMRNVSDENLAEHSAQVGMLAHLLAAIGNKRFGKQYDLGVVTSAALFHDATEVYTGDMPTPIKYYTPEMRACYQQIENQALEALLTQLPSDLEPIYREILEIPDPDVHLLVKAADKLAAYIKCVEEVKGGNTEFSDAKATTYAALTALPCPELTVFMEEFLPAFELTLDEVQQKLKTLQEK